MLFIRPNWIGIYYHMYAQLLFLKIEWLLFTRIYTQLLFFYLFSVLINNLFLFLHNLAELINY